MEGEFEVDRDENGDRGGESCFTCGGEARDEGSSARSISLKSFTGFCILKVFILLKRLIELLQPHLSFSRALSSKGFW